MRLAFIGCSGHWGFAAHGIHLCAAAGEPVAFAPGSPGEDMTPVAQFLSSHGYDTRPYADTQTLLADFTPEVCVVDSYFGDHARISLAALRNGAHVLCDKPLATREDEFAALEQSVRIHDRKLVAMLSMCYEPHFYTALAQVRGGAIGTVHMLNIQKSYKLGERPAFYRDARSYGGTLLWLGTHALDLITRFSGQPVLSVQAVHSTEGNRGHGDLEATAACVCQLGGGAVATANMDFLRPEAAPSHGDDRLRAVGDLGVVEVRADRATVLDAQGERILAPLQPPGLFADFLTYVRGETPALLTTQYCMDNTRASLAALRGAQTGCRVEI